MGRRKLAHFKKDLYMKSGLMARGWTVIDGKEYYFDETTGVLR